MTQQTQLHLDFTAPSQPHSPTSRAAAEQIRPSVGRLRQIVLDYIRSRGEAGATDEEMMDAVNLGQNTPRARRVELVRMGLVRDSNQTRVTRSGRKAVVWIATQ